MQNSVKMAVKDLDFYYGDFHALKGISLEFHENQVSALIGPSGCGKSTLLRCLNRMNDLIPISRVDGRILLDGENIYEEDIDVVTLRRRIGMVFQKPNPFPKSVYENVAYGLRIQGINKRRVLDETVEWALRGAALWDEVKDRLQEPAFGLSGGQQQRLVIARAIAVQPQVILLDEPCSGLDPISTMKVEEALLALKRDHCIVIVPHNIQEASRIGDQVAFLLMGELVEHGTAEEMFTKPRDSRTDDYITGRFG